MKNFHHDRRAVSILEKLRGIEASDPAQIFSTAEAADLFGISQSWFEVARTRGFGPDYVKRNGGRCVAYPISFLITHAQDRVAAFESKGGN